MSVLLPVKKDSLASKLCTSNMQPLTSYNAKNPSIATSLPTETMDLNLKTSVIEKESKENEITKQGIEKGDVQNSQNFTEDVKSVV